jgi:hypothetical protein
MTRIVCLVALGALAVACDKPAPSAAPSAAPAASSSAPPAALASAAPVPTATATVAASASASASASAAPAATARGADPWRAPDGPHDPLKVEDPGPAVAACKAGNDGACARAAELYLDGWGVPRDLARVALYGEIGCSPKGGNIDACAARDAAYFDAGPAVNLDVMAFRDKVLHPDTGGDDCPMVGGGPWMEAVRAKSTCTDASLGHGGVAAVKAQCLDGIADVCRGWALVGNVGGIEEQSEGLAKLCRTQGVGCETAIGKDKAEQATFNRKACLTKWWPGCAAAPRPSDEREAERLAVEACLHPTSGTAPVSFGVVGGDESGCGPADVDALTASPEASDHALAAALKHKAQPLTAAECTGPRLAPVACDLFATGIAPWGGLRAKPDAAELADRGAVLKRYCDDASLDPQTKSTFAKACKERSKAEEQVKTPAKDGQGKAP